MRHIEKPPYILMDFDYGWSRKDGADKIYISAVLFCYRLPELRKMPNISMDGTSRFLGVNIYGRRTAIESTLTSCSSLGDIFCRPWDRSLLASQLVLEAVDITSQPTIKWGHPMDAANQFGVRGTVRGNLDARIGHGKGYHRGEWWVGEDFTRIAEETALVVSPSIDRGRLEWLWEGAKDLPPEIVAAPLKTLKDNPRRGRRAIDLS